MEIRFEKVISVFDENQKLIKAIDLSKKEINNSIFSLLEICIENEENLKLIVTNDVTPYIRKIYEIINEEFDKSDIT